MIVFLGIFIGFLAAIPIGPLNVLAISQTLKRDFLHGFLVGLTASFLDICYSFASLAGIYQALTGFASLLLYLKLFGVAMLAIVSIRLFMQARAYQGPGSEQKEQRTAHRPIIAAFLCYVTNPSLYVFWLAVGGTVTAHQWVSTFGWQPIIFAISCGAGSTLWYFLLTKYVLKYHHQFAPSTFKKLLNGTAVILMAFALYLFVNIFL